MINFGAFRRLKFDWVLASAVLLLIAFGLEAIYSVDLSRGSTLLFFRKQLLFTGIGIIVFTVASLTHYSFFRSAAKLGYLGAAVLLVAVLVVGQTIRGTRGWFVVGGWSFQPVEFAKLALILMLAYIIVHFGRRFERPLFFVGTALVTGVLIGLTMLQPDLGSAVLLGLIWLGLMYLVGARRRYFFYLGIGLAIFSVVAWGFLLKDYQKDRLRNFVDPQRDPLGTGYNVNQAIIAVGSGQLFGRGLGFGSQSQLRFLPEAQTDFIFSVIAEELGFAGAAVLLILYGVILYRLYLIMYRTKDDFVLATVGGVMVLLFSQMIINVGAETGLLPVTGVTLPLVSYGGSSLVINLLLLGIVESMVGRG